MAKSFKGAGIDLFFSNPQETEKTEEELAEMSRLAKIEAEEKSAEILEGIRKNEESFSKLFDENVLENSPEKLTEIMIEEAEEYLSKNSKNISENTKKIMPQNSYFTVGEKKKAKKTVKVRVKEPEKYRFLLRLESDLWDFAAEEAWKERTSVNEYINRLIRADRQRKLNV